MAKEGSITIGTELDTKSFDAQISKLEADLQRMVKALESDAQVDVKMRMNEDERLKLESDIERTKNQIISLREQQAKTSDSSKTMKNTYSEVNSKIREMQSGLSSVASTGLKGITKKIEGIGKSVQNVTKKVVKWGLALVGIRSAYNFIRQSVSTVSQYNKGLSNQIDFMKTVIATALEPLIKRIISLAYTLLSFINNIVKKLTGKDLFETAKKNMQATSKSAKEIKKQLAGFDEMTILQDNANQSGGDGGFSTKGFEGVDSGFLSILDKIKDMITSGDWGGIARMISDGIISGLEGLAEKIKSIDWKGIGKNISEFLTNLDYSGILVGLVTVFGEAVLGLQEMFLEIDWGKILKNLSTGIKDALSKVNYYIKQIKWSDLGGTLSEAFTSVDWGGIGSEIINSLFSSFRGITEFIDGIDWTEVGAKVGDTLHDIYKTIVDNLADTDWGEIARNMVDAIFDFIDGVDWLQLGGDILLGICEGIVAWIDFIVNVFAEMVNRILDFLGIHSPSKLFEDVGVNLMKGLINGLKSLINSIVNIFKSIVTKIKNVFSGIKTWMDDKVVKPIAKIFTGLWDGIKSGVNNAWTFIKKIFSKGGKIFSGVVDGVANVFQTIVNTLIDGINRVIRVPFDLINGLLNDIRNVSILKIKPFKGLWGQNPIPVPQIPKLAKGGIINQPGRGVAIGGEAGPEAVLPLTDSQQMALLGEAIGRYITITANITNSMNGRVISREIQKISAEQDFAYNR